MPLVTLIRSLGPPLVVLGVGAVLLVRRRPVRARLMWAALAVQLAAAVLPFAWLLLQAATGLAGQNWVGLAMILVQPGVEAVAWLLALGAVAAAAPRRGSGTEPSTATPSPDAPASPPTRADQEGDAPAKVPWTQEHKGAGDA